jgi:DNA-directed RNA polymerase beta subunit
MAYFDPQDAFDKLKDKVSTTIHSYFPVQGKKQIIEASRVWVDDNQDVDDVVSQRDARLKGNTWGVPIKAELQIKDAQSGKVISTGTVKLGMLPKVTRRYSYIVNGTEWQIGNQLRLKSGVYTQIKNNGELNAQWNLAKGFGFNMGFNPETRKMSLAVGTTTVGLYPVLKTLGVPDEEMKKAWGDAVYQANVKEDHTNDLKKLYRTFAGGKNPDSMESARKTIQETFAKTELRPDSTKVTLGHPFDKVTGKALLVGSDKILKVSRREVDPDDRDSLEFKDVFSTEDLLEERLAKDRRWEIMKKLRGNVDHYSTVREVVPPDAFNQHITQFFTKSSIAERPDQINPSSFWSGNRRTTLGGEHGIEDVDKLTLSMQSISPSHMGFLDPVQTPESSSIGVNLQLALGAEKHGKELKVRAYNVKTGKEELINPFQSRWSNIAFPDQYKWVDGKPHPISSDAVKVNDQRGDVVSIHPKEVHYILKSTKGMFDINANMTPFFQNNQGTRMMMASKQMEQAVPLISREAPLVQTKGEGGGTFETLTGRMSAHVTPVGGTVTKIEKDYIHVKQHDGKTHKIPVYNDFPLNNPKSFITSEPIVKVGDKVQRGQVVSDTNYTKNGQMALGTSMRVAYMPYKGYNYDDGIVISESAAKKLTSEQMFHDGIEHDPDAILDRARFKAHTAGQYTLEQLDKLDDEAVVKEGMTVNPGDLLIGRLKKEQVTPEQMYLGKISKKFINPVRPHPLTWDYDNSGVVSKVVKHQGKITVYVKSKMPTDIGDKIVGRHGNKGVVVLTVPDAEMPQTKDGKPIDIMLNPSGIPSRINVGQVLETAAGKIAEKTGKPYIVSNFDPAIPDHARKIQAELKAHGLSDTEDLTDPKTGQVHKNVLVGPQYIMKLHHLAEVKLSARGRGTYDADLQPKSGGNEAGQKMDAYGVYALLAHGARNILRESQTIKSEMNDDVWRSIQEGNPIPPPRIPPFTYRKFESYLKGMGVNVTKEGNFISLSPLTDKSKTLEHLWTLSLAALFGVGFMTLR